MQYTGYNAINHIFVERYMPFYHIHLSEVHISTLFNQAWNNTPTFY